MHSQPPRAATGPTRAAPYVGGALLLVLFGVEAFLRGVRVPLLGWIDLAIHEFGHLAFLWAPRDVMLVMGNGTQFLVPLGLGLAFIVRERDLLGMCVCFGWAATSAQDASVYIADAPWRILPLLGPESSHDWWQLLGAHGLLDRAEELASLVWTGGLLLWLTASALVVLGPWREHAIRELGVRGLWQDPSVRVDPLTRLPAGLRVHAMDAGAVPQPARMTAATLDAHLGRDDLPSVADALRRL